jgi:hypothetical protein
MAGEEIEEKEEPARHRAEFKHDSAPLSNRPKTLAGARGQSVTTFASR